MIHAALIPNVPSITILRMSGHRSHGLQFPLCGTVSTTCPSSIPTMTEESCDWCSRITRLHVALASTHLLSQATSPHQISVMWQATWLITWGPMFRRGRIASLNHLTDGSPMKRRSRNGKHLGSVSLLFVPRFRSFRVYPWYRALDSIFLCQVSHILTDLWKMLYEVCIVYTMGRSRFRSRTMYSP